MYPKTTFYAMKINNKSKEHVQFLAQQKLGNLFSIGLVFFANLNVNFAYILTLVTYNFG